MTTHRVRPSAPSAAALLLLLAAPASARNYLVIIADDLGADKVSGYAGDYPGYQPDHLPQTAAIDSLADAGIRFTRGWANPLCVPTRTSLQTGVYALRHGQGQSIDLTDLGIDPDAWDLLGEVFSRNGHATAYFGKWQIGNEDEAGNVGYPSTSPFTDQPHAARSGFAHFDGSLIGIGSHGSYYDWPRMVWSDSDWLGELIYEPAHPTEVLTDAAADWIAAQAGPWLAFLAYMAPHGLSLDDAAGPSWRYGDTDPSCVRSADLVCLGTESCVDETRAVYQGLVECLDLHVESLLSGMDAATLDDTTIVFLGDNGTPLKVTEDLFDHRNRGKGTVFESGVRVPFLVADGATWRTGAAGVIASPGRTSNATVHTTDLYATLTDDAFGYDPGLDSRSFVSCFADPSADCGWGDVLGYTEVFDQGPAGKLLKGQAALREGPNKLILRYKRSSACFLRSFVDVDDDPFELNPLPLTDPLVTELWDEFVALQAEEGGWADGIPFCP